MIYPKLLEELIEYFKKLPGIGEKTAERLALSLLDYSEEDINLFSKNNNTFYISINEIEEIIKQVKKER